MKTITVKWNLGNFSMSGSAEMNEVQQQAAMELGLLYLCQRVSKVDKTLGGFIGTGKGAKRKVGWKRGDVDFTPDLADKLVGDFTEVEFPQDGVSKLPLSMSVCEYVRDVQEIKHADARKAMERHESADDLESWLADKIGYAGPTHGEDGEFALPALQAITAFIKTL